MKLLDFIVIFFRIFTVFLVLTYIRHRRAKKRRESIRTQNFSAATIRMHQDLIIIKLIVNQDNKASITFEDTLGIFFSQIIPFTDCPEGEWMFYFNDNVFFWNGEY